MLGNNSVMFEGSWSFGLMVSSSYFFQKSRLFKGRNLIIRRGGKLKFMDAPQLMLDNNPAKFDGCRAIGF